MQLGTPGEESRAEETCCSLMKPIDTDTVDASCHIFPDISIQNGPPKLQQRYGSVRIKVAHKMGSISLLLVLVMDRVGDKQMITGSVLRGLSNFIFDSPAKLSSGTSGNMAWQSSKPQWRKGERL